MRRVATKGMALTALAALVVLSAPAARAQAQSVDRVGDAYEIRLESVSETRGEGSSGSSHSAYTLVERVIAVRDGASNWSLIFPRTPRNRIAPAIGNFRRGCSNRTVVRFSC